MLSTGFHIVEGPYFHDLMAQPQALGATLAALDDSKTWSATRDFVMARSWRRIVLTGMGSSFHALHPLSLSLIGAGFTPLMMETAELVHYGLPLCDDGTLVVLMSQSGQSAETLALLDHNGRAPVLGITNTPDSVLARRADTVLMTQAGPEFSVSCKTYVSGMLLLQWLQAIFAGESERDTLSRLTPAITLAEQYLKEWRPHVAVLGGLLRGSRHLFLAGRGGSLAAVGTGALIIKESSHFHAEGMSSAAFRHGPLEMLGNDVATFVFSGDRHVQPLNHRLVRELVSGGVHCEEIGPGAGLDPLRIPDCDSLVRPILEILPVELMTLALAGLANREAGKFERASKVTATE